MFVVLTDGGLAATSLLDGLYLAPLTSPALDEVLFPQFDAGILRKGY